MMSLEKSDKIRFVLCRHEQAAAFMADVYGRLTGRAAVCLGTLEPGALHHRAVAREACRVHGEAGP